MESSETQSRLQRFVKRRVSGLTIKRKDLLTEVSGALGDLGTYIPIIISLALVNGLDLGTSLIFNGSFNVITGVLFGVPVPVQPMHTIAAVSLSNHLRVPEIMAAGLCVSFILLALGATNLTGVVNSLVPLPVVRGIQAGQGLTFAIKGVTYILHHEDFARNKVGANRPWVGMDGRILAIFAFLFVIVATGVGGEFSSEVQCDPQQRRLKAVELEEHHSVAVSEVEEENVAAEDGRKGGWRGRVRRSWRALDARFFPKDTIVENRRLNFVVPACLIVFLLGVVLAFIRRPGTWAALTIGPSTPQVQHISAADWKTGFLKAAIPQLPLSLLNSVIAVVKMANDLFPERAAEVTTAHVAASVGVMNIVGCWFGAMPVCHGCGGLAGQYRFGARSGLAVVMLGAAKIALGLLLGSSLVKVMTAFPVGLLGVLLLYAALELAMCARDQTSRAGSFVALLVVAVWLTWNNGAYAFLCGMAVSLVFKLRDFHLRGDVVPDVRTAVA